MQKLSDARSHDLYLGTMPLATSVAPLAAAAVDLSDFIEVNQLSRLCGTVYADQGGTLQIEFSNDGTNVDYVRTIAVSASDTANSAWDQMVIAPYVRFRYTNGAVQQTVYRFHAHGRVVS